MGPKTPLHLLRPQRAGHEFSPKTPEQALEQFRYLAGRWHGVRSFLVADNIIDVGYFKSVLPALAEDRPGYDIFYETKANLTRAQIETWPGPALRALHSARPGVDQRSAAGLDGQRHHRAAEHSDPEMVPGNGGARHLADAFLFSMTGWSGIKKSPTSWLCWCTCNRPSA